MVDSLNQQPRVPPSPIDDDDYNAIERTRGKARTNTGPAVYAAWGAAAMAACASFTKGSELTRS